MSNKYTPGSADPRTVDDLYRFIVEELARISDAMGETERNPALPPDPTDPPTFEGNTYVLVGGTATELNVLVSGVSTPLTTL